MLTVQQKKNIQLTVISLMVLLLIFVAGFVYKVNKPRVMTKSELKINGAYLFDKPRSFGPFDLIDYNNKAFTLEQLKGKWSLIFFGFTYCPDVCPTTMALFNRFYQKQLDGRFGDDTQIIMVSVDPARDIPEKLKTYVQYFNQDFIGVTGEFLDLKRFATSLNIPFQKVPGGGENYMMEHSGNVALINPRGHYVGFFRAPLELAKLNVTYQSIRMVMD
jgi:protein SCO1/2